MNSGGERTETYWHHKCLNSEQDNLACYAKLLTARYASQKVIGEFSPNYVIFGEKEFEEIFKHLGAIKLILMLRDPICQLFSSIKYGAIQKNQVSESECNKRLRRALMSFDPNSTSAINYKKTYESVLKYFPSENLFVGFYENLFTVKEYSNMCNFLGISFRQFDCADVVNASPGSEFQIYPDLASLGRRQLEGVYDWAKDRFGSRCPWT